LCGFLVICVLVLAVFCMVFLCTFILICFVWTSVKYYCYRVKTQLHIIIIAATHHSLYISSGQAISSSQNHHNREHSQVTHIDARAVIRTHRRAAADLHLRPVPAIMYITQLYRALLNISNCDDFKVNFRIRSTRHKDAAKIKRDTKL
jgi:hypothetical protein